MQTTEAARHPVQEQPDIKPWSSLSADEQLALRIAYQDELDRNPLTCSLDEKTARFTAWLAERRVSFSPDDLRPKRR